MSSSVKKKIRLGTLFLFLLLLLSGGVGIFHLVRLKNDAADILKDNYESLDYCHRMQAALDSFPVDPANARVRFGQYLSEQEQNITEPGEKTATANIRIAFDRSQKTASLAVDMREIQQSIQRILTLNMQAIEYKNAKAAATADKALAYISVLAAITFIIGFTFSFNFPMVVSEPINAMAEGIQAISRKDYQHRIQLNRKDEFGQLADAFNGMAERLEYFESSNLNKILFEKTRAEAVINSLKEASIGIDKNGLILFANEEALQLLGLQANEMVGKPVDEIAKKNDLLRFLLEEKDSLPFKVVVGNRENYFTKESIDINQEGNSSKLIVLRNITSFKELDVAKSNFIATISHELKTPLASSDFSLKLLSDTRVGELSREQKELVQQLKDDNQRMLRILGELLNLSQVETGKIQIEMVPVNPLGIVENALSAATNASRDKNITITTALQDPLPKILADAEKTGWVLTNFLINAIKHSPEGASILLQTQEADGTLRISVTDQGPGIAEEYHSRVFDRFFRVPGSKTAGTGLGLSISKEFIEAQNGEIWLQSEIGVGSVFGFSLPVASGLPLSPA